MQNRSSTVCTRIYWHSMRKFFAIVCVSQINYTSQENHSQLCVKHTRMFLTPTACSITKWRYIRKYLSKLRSPKTSGTACLRFCCWCTRKVSIISRIPGTRLLSESRRIKLQLICRKYRHKIPEDPNHVSATIIAYLVRRKCSWLSDSRVRVMTSAM